MKDLQVPIDTKLDSKSCCYLLIIYLKNASQKVKKYKILAVHRCSVCTYCQNFTILYTSRLFVLVLLLCPCVTWKMHLFIVNLVHIIFSCVLLSLIICKLQTCVRRLKLGFIARQDRIFLKEFLLSDFSPIFLHFRYSIHISFCLHS